MKKKILQLSIFLVLILTLIIGLSYVSLDRDTTSQDVDIQEDRMSIALVNEDDGATFDGVELGFGDAFVQSINQNNHEWFVVSRGVAESGLERNTYDMMIVIPKDFTEKALSIDSESPEQVVLNYKINASDSEAVRAQAEETASNILNDFNRRIIDVYFASVIGNLQEAQDNVANFVEEYEELTYTYNNAVHNPLSSYTNQFTMIKDNTEVSKDSFGGFENTLNSYEENLVEQLGSFEDYQSNIQDVEETQQSNSAIHNDFAEQLNGFQNGLDNGDVNSQLKNLQDTNDYINAQFQLNNENQEDPLENLAFHTRGLQNRLNTALQSIEEEQENFDIVAINSNVKERLATFIDEAFDGNDQVTALLASQQDRLLDRVEDQIAQLPSLDEEALEESDLSPEMIKEIQNVMKVTKKYNDEFNEVYPVNRDLILPEHIQALKEDLNINGVELKDTVILPESEKPLREFKVTDIPEGFAISRLSIQLPDGEDHTIYNYQENDEIELPTYQNGKFTVTLTLRLKDDYLDQPLDVYDMKRWKWELYQIDEEDAEQLEQDDEAEEEEPMTEEPTQIVASYTVAQPVDDTGETDEDTETDSSTDQDDGPGNDDQNNNQEDSSNSNDGENEHDQSDENTGEDSDESNQDGENPGENDGSEEGSEEDPVEDDGSTGEEEETPGEDGENNDEEENPNENEEEQKEIEIVEIDHHYIRHTVKTPVIDDATEDLIRAVEDTIAPYQRLLASYEAYFGLDLACNDVDPDSKDCASVDQDESLTELASDQSLYALFNKDVGELLTDYIADQVIADVTEEIREPLANYEKQMEEYRRYINTTIAQADELASTVVNTREAARILNENLQATLENITEWREQSLSLIDSQSEIQNTNEQEQQMVMSLSEGFQPVFSQSQTLADQASNNLNEAETVYQTFERIDEQADTIQQSGSDLIQEAEVLATNMTNKLMSDQEFVDNFTNVMANSRIGDRQNEDLYDFLANPVETRNEGVIVERADTFTAYFLVLICFLVALFTGYGISTISQKRMAENQFEEEKSIVSQNGLITGIIASVGVLEGLVLGLVSAYLLQISGGKLILWTGLLILIMFTMVLTATYLLRQLKMIGMFLLLGVLSMYLFLTNALTNSLSGVGDWRDFSPLQYVERLLNRVVQGSSDYGFIVFGLIVIALLAVLANLLVVTRKSSQVTEDDENVA
ncbi:type VII secretion protein EsaA [Gracilibacillus thailandensis]|uniref:Type VII secretion system accessory factor EsaA n=1 Tax=Gracilibacillus thailandensis TaxID=563735 RepID=A0A6N7QXG9_9BACI|nr:type VII secretion protein EsaA [Gracilibacillus thailandensis]MRI66747.1 type VII secretion protein EsaA [Gracilibacillus thailandensis]